MVVHVYTFCWNESFLIPFFLHHYDFADKIIVHDNESDDNSVELLKQNPKVVVKSFSSNSLNSLDVITALRNSCWKESEGQADWVIILDIDEFIYHPDGVPSVLDTAARNQFNVLKPYGYNMITDVLPNYSSPLTKQVQYGVSSEFLDKPCIFRIKDISKTCITPGGHESYPRGKNVRVGRVPDLKLLHYKYITYERYVDRTRLFANRVDHRDLARGWNQHYWTNDERLHLEFYTFWNTKEKVI